MRRPLTFLALLLAARPAAAQLREVTKDEATPDRIRGVAGVQLDITNPEGDFGRFVHTGVGASGFVGVGLTKDARVSIGLEGGFVNYGHQLKTVPLSPTIPGLYVDVSTNNNIATLGIPLRVELTPGPVRPYLTGSLGFAYFWTQTGARGTDSNGDFATTINYSDMTANWTAGGGFAIQVSRGRTPVAIDIGIRRVNNGIVKYLNEDSIQDGGGGTTIITPIRSEANFTAWRIGASFGLR